MSKFDLDAVAHQLADDGLVHLPRRTDLDLVELLEVLGKPIYVEEVRVDPSSNSLVKSSDGISWHTDHHRAHIIVWQGRQPADEGGETLVVDGIAAYRSLPAHQQQALRQVTLMEHSVFKGDADQHPMLTEDNGKLRLYYSFWMAQDRLPDAQQEAFEAYANAVEAQRHHRFRLDRGDILAIDNRRMLHARSPIKGRAVRHLRRYWLTAT